MTPVQTATTLASNYFGQPLWLLAALALIPLLIFYLVRPKPEEQIMPSMMFFMKQDSSGTVSHALQTLLRNLLLLLHILLVLGFAAALAHPFIEGVEKPDKTVVVFDRSASMENDMSAAKSFVGSNLGAENTLIIVDNGITVALEEASASQVRSYLRGIETRDVETNIAAGLDTASAYEGQLIVASDMAQSVNARDATELLNQLRQSREAKVYTADNSNSWGIVSVDPGLGNSTIDVKNYLEEDTEITIRTGDGGRRINIEAGSVKTVTVATEAGRNEFALEDDGVMADNTAYISVPDERNFEVAYIADQNNPYFQKAVELIDFTEFTYYEPPLDTEVEADIYVIGPSSKILRSTVEDIEDNIRDGKAGVLFGQADMGQKGIDAVPRINNEKEENVEIVDPVKANIDTTVYGLNTKGFESYSNPEEAVMMADIGRGKLLVYNIDDSDFNQEFVYPIFWKRIFEQLTDKPSINNLNRETGDSVEGREIVLPNGETAENTTEMIYTGFYNASGITYAANLESDAESGTEEPDLEEGRLTDQKTDQDVQNLAAVIIGAVAIGELLYLMYIGEV